MYREKTLPLPTGGISQALPQLAAPGITRDQVNMFVDLTKGLRRRPGLELYRTPVESCVWYKTMLRDGEMLHIGLRTSLVGQRLFVNGYNSGSSIPVQVSSSDILEGLIDTYLQPANPDNLVWVNIGQDIIAVNLEYKPYLDVSTLLQLENGRLGVMHNR
jgi:hypothetical protein